LAVIGLLRMRRRFLFDPVFMWALVFTLLWSAQYGATTAGNLGSLVRYRLQVYPFLIGIIIYLLFYGRREANESELDRGQTFQPAQLAEYSDHAQSIKDREARTESHARKQPALLRSPS
jgi:hypothetical protein